MRTNKNILFKAFFSHNPSLLECAKRRGLWWKIFSISSFRRMKMWVRAFHGLNFTIQSSRDDFIVLSFLEFLFLLWITVEFENGKISIRSSSRLLYRHCTLQLWSDYGSLKKWLSFVRWLGNRGEYHEPPEVSLTDQEFYIVIKTPWTIPSTTKKETNGKCC